MDGDRLRPSDSTQLASFGEALAGADTSYADRDTAMQMMRMAGSSLSIAKLPVLLLVHCESEEAHVLRTMMLNYGAAIASNGGDAEVVASRSKSLEKVRMELRDALRRDQTKVNGSEAEKRSESQMYDLFALEEVCSDEELRNAYRDQIKAWHPDRMQQLPAEIQALAEAKLKVLNTAYDALTTMRRQ